jgi:hypothetical protein
MVLFQWPEPLRVRLRVLEQAARCHRLRRVDGVLSEVHVLNDPLLVDDERRTLSQLVTRATDLFETHGHAILPEHLETGIAQEGKVNVDLFREGRVRCGAITTNAKNHRVIRIQLGPINLIGFEFAASGVGKGKHIKNEDDVLLTSKIAELDLLPIVAQQREIWRFVTGAQHAWRWDFGECRGSNGQGHHSNEYP